MERRCGESLIETVCGIRGRVEVLLPAFVLFRVQRPREYCRNGGVWISVQLRGGSRKCIRRAVPSREKPPLGYASAKVFCGTVNVAATNHPLSVGSRRRSRQDRQLQESQVRRRPDQRREDFQRKGSR